METPMIQTIDAISVRLKAEDSDMEVGGEAEPEIGGTTDGTAARASKIGFTARFRNEMPLSIRGIEDVKISDGIVSRLGTTLKTCLLYTSRCV